MPARRANKPSVQKKRKLTTTASPPSPPRILLPPLLQKSWAFVRDAEQAQGRTLAPLTGSKLEAQLLIHRIESTCPIEASPVPLLERTLSIIEELPNPLPGVSEQEWAEFRRDFNA